MSQLKWVDVFKNVSITGDNDIPINKRGSGVRRLILLNFFRAEADRKMKELALTNSTASIIYAVEEPETSQHFSNQIKLIDAFKKLSSLSGVQVIMTTHSGTIVKKLEFNNLRLIDNSDSNNGTRIKDVVYNCFPYPSLNEVNFLAFDQATEEYHDELYGFIQRWNLLEEYKRGKKTQEYIKVGRDGSLKPCRITLSEYIRHQIHHPENQHNSRYTYSDLKKSIEEMRDFIKNHSVDSHENLE